MNFPYISYSIYQSLIALVNQNKAVHCLLILVHGEITNVNKILLKH